MAIIVSRGGKDARRLEEAGVRDEAYLQRYVSDNPNCLPLDEIKEDARLLVIGREFPTRSGPIDILAVDRDGDLYIIETKLYRNPDKRRVVAQVLDYGASLWKVYGNGDAFIRDVDEFIEGNGGLSDHLQRAFEVTEEEALSVVQALKRKLSAGNIKFLVLMDRLREELRDLILFINAKSNFDMYAVEMEFYRHDGLEIVIPKLFGAEVKKEVADPQATDPKYVWTEQRFMEEAQGTLAPEAFAAIEKLCALSKAVGGEIEWKCLTFHSGGKANVVIAPFGRRRLYSFGTDGVLTLDFQKTEQSGAAREQRGRLRAALIEAGFTEATRLEEGKKPSMGIDEWGQKLAVFGTMLGRFIKPAERQDPSFG